MSASVIPSPLGRDSHPHVPWVTLALLAICVVTYSLGTVESQQAEATAEAELQAAIDYLFEYPYLEPEAILRERVDPSRLHQSLQQQEKARVRRGAPPIPQRVKEKQRAHLDELVAHAVAALAALPSQRFGVNAADLAPYTLFTHVFVYASSAHLLCSLALLLILGSQLESAWGSALFAGFVVAASAVSGATFALANPGFAVPLIGMGGVVAALLAAFAICLRSVWHHPVFLFCLALGASFLILPVRLGNEWSLAAGLGPTGALASHGGASYWSVGGGFAFGLLGQLLIGLFGGARARGDSPARRKATRVIDPQLESIIDARAAGREGEAYDLLSEFLREHPDDHEALLVMWDVAFEHGRPAEAADAMLRALRDEVKHNDAAAAVEHWLDLSGRALQADAEPALLIRLALMLQNAGRSQEAVAALRQALEKSGDADAAVVATRVARASRHLDAETSRKAAWRALGSVDLDLEQRQNLESLLGEIGAVGEETDYFGARAGREIDAGPDAHGAEVSKASPTAPAASAPEVWVDPALAYEAGPAAETSALALDDIVGAPGEAADAESAGFRRPEPIACDFSVREVRVVPAQPLALTSEDLRIETEPGGKKRLSLARVEAISVAAVAGLSEKPVLLIDLVMNWTSGGDAPLKVVRLRGDRFDARRFVGAAASPLDALRRFVDALLRGSGATPLPDASSARGMPFASFDDLDGYQRSVLGTGGDESA